MIEKFNILSLDFDKLELNIAKLEELELIESWDHMVWYPNGLLRSVLKFTIIVGKFGVAFRAKAK